MTQSHLSSSRSLMRIWPEQNPTSGVSKKTVMVTLSMLLALSACDGAAARPMSVASPICADNRLAKEVGEFVSSQNGASLFDSASHLKVTEPEIASALARDGAANIAIGSRARFFKTWYSIDTWGAETAAYYALSNDGIHEFLIPTLVPISAPITSDGFLNMYAENGDGVHAHVDPDDIAFIVAAATPGPGATPNRYIGFYNSTGDLALGIYASIAGKAADPDAVTGFEQTRGLIASMPQACD